MDPCTGRRDSMDNAESMKMPYKLLITITDDFSEKLGSGTFGVVYKGKHANGDEIAVKVLRDMAALDDKDFRNEFQNLARLKHQNIVQLVGYCNESEEQIVELDDGTKVNAEKMHMALCFEYVDNGSLHDHISDENRGLEWHVRYKIIKGICEGLKHLREGLEKPVWHLDLKPANILLDKEMMPKIADFGLSRLLGDETTRKTMSSVGTLGYWPPEYLLRQLISGAFDIFSLGVIITKIMIGTEGYNSCADLPPRKFVKHVHNNWKKKLQETVKLGSLEGYCQQVKTCIEMASKCLNEDRSQRPSVQEIVVTLNQTETEIPRIPLRVEQFHNGESSSILPSNRSTRVISSSKGDQPKQLPFVLLKFITHNFSTDRLIGVGGLGRVYKGIYEDGQVVAVKVLRNDRSYNEKQLYISTEALLLVNHKNIIRFLGYCFEEQGRLQKYKGKAVIADESWRVLCFEYSQNGSLDQHISDESRGLDWCTRYNIIKGTCDALRYLHEECHIIHMNLKPSNILLDENMVPKIGDIGLSRLLDDEETRRTIGSFRTLVNVPPEFINKQVITLKSDIYSLGVIIVEIVTGKKVQTFSLDASSQEFIENVLGKWRKRLQVTTLKARSVEGYCQQVKTCIEIALRCVEVDRNRRPYIGDVVRELDETETLIHDDDEPLDVQPMELRFPFQPKKHGSCLLQLHNKEDDRVAFRLVSKSPKRYHMKLPLFGIVPPRCTYNLALTTSKQSQRPPSDSDEGFVLQSIAVSHLQQLQLQGLDQTSLVREYHSLFKEAQETAGDEVQEVTLKSVCAALAEDSPPKLTRPEIEIIATLNAHKVSSIEVHPTKPWIMTTHQGGNLRVWNYKTMKVMNSFEDEPVYVAKFIARSEEWIVAGDDNGQIHVYSYDEESQEACFEAHNGRIMSLAVHPTDSYVLSSSHGDHLIKLWHWDPYWDFEKGSWVCTRTFEGHSDKVSQVVFNQKNTGSFASASWDGTVKIWDLNSDACNTITLDKHPEGLLCVDYITDAERQHLITGSKDRTAQIWDMETKHCREYLQGHAHHISVVYYYSEHQKLITGSLDGTVRIWDSTTYRPENVIAFNLGEVYDFGYIEDLQRIVVGCHQGIAMMEINFP